MELRELTGTASPKPARYSFRQPCADTLVVGRGTLDENLGSHEASRDADICMQISASARRRYLHLHLHNDADGSDADLAITAGSISLPDLFFCQN